MYRPSMDWNPRQTRFRELIMNPDQFQEAMKLCCELHAFVHQYEVYDVTYDTLADKLCENLQDKDFGFKPAAPGQTIAWNLWHIARIEDATMNILVGSGKQVLNKTWLKKMNAPVTDTGNAMTGDGIISFSKQIKPGELLAYRRAVGIRSREILSTLKSPDVKRKFPPERVEQIVIQSCLTSHPRSIWLKDFWGKKTVAGILLLPLTRHQAEHLNDCLKIKKKIK